MDLPYQIFNASGQRVMHAPESCRYPRKIELSILEAGYTIKLNGRKVAKTEIRKDIRQK